MNYVGGICCFRISGGQRTLNNLHELLVTETSRAGRLRRCQLNMMDVEVSETVRIWVYATVLPLDDPNTLANKTCFGNLRKFKIIFTPRTRSALMTECSMAVKIAS